jgi:hypothetical protein
VRVLDLVADGSLQDDPHRTRKSGAQHGIALNGRNTVLIRPSAPVEIKTFLLRPSSGTVNARQNAIQSQRLLNDLVNFEVGAHGILKLAGYPN